MKKLLLYFYNFLHWLVGFVIILALFLVFFIEHPSTILPLVNKQLKEQGISYKSLEGGILSGLTLKEVNYKNQVKVKRVNLKIDWEKLENRILYLDNISIEDVEIDEKFLTSLMESNNTEKKEEQNITLPFDEVVLNRADISLKNIVYESYKIDSAELKVKNLVTDMKKRYKGDIELSLDSNVTKLELKGSIKDNFVTLTSKLEPNRKFINSFVADKNITFLNNPLFTLRGSGDIKKVKYHIDIHRLDIEQNKYRIESKKLISFGSYDLTKKHLNGEIQTNLKGNMGDIKFNGDCDLNLEDINGSLRYRFDGILKPKKDFLTRLLQKEKITFNSSPTVEIKSSGGMDKLKYHLKARTIDIKQDNHLIKSNKLLLYGDFSPIKGDLTTGIKTYIVSNIANIRLSGDAKLNLNDINNTLNHNLIITTVPDKNFLTDILKKENIIFKGSPTIKIKSSGGMKRLKYDVVLKKINLKRDIYSIDNGEVLLNGYYGVLDRKISTDIESDIKSNVANLRLSGNGKVDLDDLNNTLKFDILTDIKPNLGFVNSQLSDTNISIKRLSKVDISAKGMLKDIECAIKLKDLGVKKDDINLNIKPLSLTGKTNPIDGDVNGDLFTKFYSNVGDGYIKNRFKLNFYHIKERLKYSAKIEVKGKAKYLNKFLKEEKVEILNSPKISLEANGSFNRIALKLDGNGNFKKDGEVAKMVIKSEGIKVDLHKNFVDGKIRIDNSSKKIGFNFNGKFFGDYTKPKELKIDTTLAVKSFHMFGINLNPISPLTLKIKNNSFGAFVNIDSKRIKLSAKTEDHDYFRFYIKSRSLYLYKMIKLPSEFDHKFIRMDLKGSVRISKKYFSIEGTIDSNKKFKAKIDVKNNENGIDGTVKTKNLVAKINGNIEKKRLDSELKIVSLKGLQVELNKLFPFKKINIDGSLIIGAKLNGEEVFATVKSDKLTLSGFNIEGIDLDANYKDDLLTINKLNLQTTGFEDRKLNKRIYLNKKGTIYLGSKKSILLDIYPNILIKADGDEEYLDGRVTIDGLPMGHPDYGTMFLSCDIDYRQRGLDKEIEGYIDIRRMKLFYEAKFLEADYDPDVIIISKRNKKIEVEKDTFLNHTAIDLSINTSQANYRTPDIDLLFDINLRVKKDFGKPLAILGKIEDINGRVDQVPKRFLVKNSNVVFIGDGQLNPILDINVEHQLPQVTIYITIGGNANRPKIEFASEPPMPKKDIMSYLLLGVSATQIADGEGSLGREAELFMLNQAARDLAYEFELDKIFIKDDEVGEGFAVEVGKKVGKSNMLIIESSKQGNSFILEHDINRDIKVRVGQHQKDIPSQSIDIYFRKRFK